LLLHRGFQIIHSTRHAPIEHGKDIIARGPDGVVHAYQLKGDPGGRLTTGKFRGLQEQLFELCHYGIDIPGVEGDTDFRAYLVTNGRVEEETSLAIARFNRKYEGKGAARLECMQRGDLLAGFLNMGLGVWPSELSSEHTLIELMIADGRSPLPLKLFQKLLATTLLLEPEQDGGVPTRPELRRRTTAAAMLVAVATQQWEKSENHAGIAAAWTLYIGMVFAAYDRWNGNVRDVSSSVNQAKLRVRDALIDLANELMSRTHWVEGEALIDAFVYRARITKIAGLLSVLYFWLESTSWPESLSRKDFVPCVQSLGRHVHLWGEGALPQVLLHYWFMRATTSASAIEMQLASIVSALTPREVNGKSWGPAGPYWTFPEVVKADHPQIFGPQPNLLAREARGGYSHFLWPCFQLLCRTNRKTTCWVMWPGASVVPHSEFRPSERWMFSLPTAPDGHNTTRMHALPMTWDNLKHESRKVACESTPPSLAKEHLVLALYVQQVPYRALPDVVRHLGWKLDPTWFIGPPIE
jgi:hypothetical protein